MRTQRRWFEIGSILLLASALLACPGNGGTVAVADPSAGTVASPEVGRSNPIPPGDVLVPDSLGTIKESFAGTSGRPTVFVIGENHVNLDIQKRLADLLAYLRNAYDVKVVCSEGTDKPLKISRTGLTTAALRDMAEADLDARRINGVEFFALAYPDVRVVGVEDMEAHTSHRTALSSTPPELEAWLRDFQKFLEEDVQALPEDRVQLAAAALEKLNQTKDLEGFFEELGAILGPASAEGKRLAELVAARSQAIEKIQSKTHGDDPLMIRRDKRMVQETLEVASAEPVALVVGSLHLEGITQKLKAADQPYVAVLTKGAEKTDPVAGDNEVYKRWQEGKPEPLEEWLSRLKPGPALQRETMHQKVVFLGALFHAHRLLREGSAVDQVRAALGGVMGNLEIVDCYPIDGGYGIDFKVNGKPGRAYFSSQPLRPLTGEGFSDRLEKGKAGGLYYAVFDGGSGGGPPIIPRLPAPASDGDGPFNKRLFVALDEQRRKNPTAATATLILESGGALVLLVGDRRRPLSISKEELERLVEAYLAAEEGPELLLAAQKLSAALLTGIDQDLPADARSLYLISQNDLLRDISLPQVAALTSEPGTARFAGLEETFVLPWKKAQSDLAPLSRERSLVEVGRTVFWMGEGLEKDAQNTQTVAAIRATGVRVNEPLRPGDTLILLGTGAAGWTARLSNGKTVTAKASMLRGADGVVSLGVDLAREPGVDALMVREMEGSEALSFGRELAERIRKSSGKERLDRLVRRKSAEPSKATLARRSLIANLSAVERAQQQVDRKATSV